MMMIVVMMVGRHNGWLLVSGIYELCSLTHTDAIFHSLSLSPIWPGMRMRIRDDDGTFMMLVVWLSDDDDGDDDNVTVVMLSCLFHSLLH